jgi:hypothetical protein
VLHAAQLNYWSSVPFLAMFSAGFWYAAGGSLFQLLPHSWFSSREGSAI